MVKVADKKSFGLYGGSNPADMPMYTLLDASRATGVPTSTIGVWVHGMRYTTRKGERKRYAPILQVPDREDPRLSFNNVLEVNSLRALRAKNEVKLRSVREAIANARRDLKIDRLLIHPNLRASGGELFLDYYFKLVTLSNSRQEAMRAILEHSLKRIEYDEQLRASFYPIPRFMNKDERPILVSPYVSFGSAVIERRGVTTYVIRSRRDAGEKREDIIADYDLSNDEYEEAIQYESAA
jgi:uncharacterized protein (DUF433 family)